MLLKVLGSASSTYAAALRSPNPKRLLTQNPTALRLQPGLSQSGWHSLVHATRCCTSRQAKLGLETMLGSITCKILNQTFCCTLLREGARRFLQREAGSGSSGVFGRTFIVQICTDLKHYSELSYALVYVLLCKCARTIFSSSSVPLEYVVAIVEAQRSAYQDDWQS